MILMFEDSFQPILILTTTCVFRPYLFSHIFMQLIFKNLAPVDDDFMVDTIYLTNVVVLVRCYQ